jgi:hypothetical protein
MDKIETLHDCETLAIQVDAEKDVVGIHLLDRGITLNMSSAEALHFSGALRDAESRLEELASLHTPPGDDEIRH